jgi:hypothetical protein
MSGGKLVLRGYPRKDVLVPGPPEKMTFRHDIEVEMQDPLHADRDPKLAKVRAQILADINEQIAKIWRERAGGPPKLTAADLSFSVIGDGKKQ